MAGLYTELYFLRFISTFNQICIRHMHVVWVTAGMPLTLLFMAFMTPTNYLALLTISTGCFGNALVISNWIYILKHRSSAAAIVYLFIISAFSMLHLQSLLFIATLYAYICRKLLIIITIICRSSICLQAGSKYSHWQKFARSPGGWITFF